MTPATVMSMIRDLAVESSASFWSDAEIYRYMTAGETIIAMSVDCTETSSTSTTTVAGTREYSKPTGCIKITRLLYDSLKLKKIDMRDVDLVEGTAYGGVTSQANCVYYYERGNYVGLSPLPSAAKTLTVYYTVEPTALASTSTSFTMPNTYGSYLADYCLYRMFLKDQKLEAEASAYLRIWENNLRTIKKSWMENLASDRFYAVKDENLYPSSDIGII